MEPDQEAVLQLVQQQVQLALQPAQAHIEVLTQQLANAQMQAAQAEQSAAAAQQVAAQAAAAAAQAAHAAPAPAASNRLRPAQPDGFTGQPGSNSVDNFLHQVRQYCDLQGEANETAQVRYAASLLRGSAGTWWRAYTTRNASPTLWQEFSTLLRSQFQPLDRVKIARDRLATLRQVRSVREYTTQFRTLLLEIPDIAMSEIMDRYTRGLKEQVRKEVELRDPPTLEEANRIAERQDAISMRVHRTGHSNRPEPRRSYATVVRDGAEPMQLDAVRTRPLPRPKMRQPQDRAMQRSKDMLANACFHCHRPGHRIADCPLRRQSQGLRPTVQRSSYSMNADEQPSKNGLLRRQ
jgi:hypothetical protein